MMGDIQLHSNREAVWAKLNDPAVLKSCIPGCEQLDMLSDSEFRRSRPSRSVLSRRAGRAKSGSQTSIRPTATASPERVTAASPASPRGQPRSRLRTTMGARSCPTMLSRRSVESSPSSASASSTARRRKPPTISSKNSEPPSQPTHRPHRHVDKSVADAPWWCLATGASNVQLPVRTKNQTSCDDRHQTSAQNADGPR